MPLSMLSQSNYSLTTSALIFCWNYSQIMPWFSMVRCLRHSTIPVQWLFLNSFGHLATNGLAECYTQTLSPYLIPMTVSITLQHQLRNIWFKYRATPLYYSNKKKKQQKYIWTATSIVNLMCSNLYSQNPQRKLHLIPF